MKPAENTEQNQTACASETDAKNKKNPTTLKAKNKVNFQTSFDFNTLWEYR